MKAKQFRQQLPRQQNTAVAAKKAKTKLQAGQDKPRLSKSDNFVLAELVQSQQCDKYYEL